MVRPKKNILSPEIIAATALRLVEKDNDFTMPGIAAALGVNPSSLYHHVMGGRIEIIDLIRRQIYSEINLSELSDTDRPWGDRLRKWIRSYRDASARVPAALPLLVGSPVNDFRTLQIYDVLFTLLTEAGIPTEQQLSVSAMLDAIVIGSAIDAASPVPLWGQEPEFPRLSKLSPTPHMKSRTLDGFGLAIEAAVMQVTSLVPSPVGESNPKPCRCVESHCLR